MLDTSASVNRAIRELEKESGMAWRKIKPYDLDYYKSRRLDAVYFCPDRNCRHGIYLVPEHLHTRFNVMTRVLRYLKNKGLEFIPAVKCDLDDFPAPPPLILNLELTRIILTMKIDGDLILRRLGSFNPVTYSISSLTAINYNAVYRVGDYIQAWGIKSTIQQNDGSIRLTLKNSMSYEEANIDLTTDGRTWTGSSTLPPTKFVTDSGWEIEGQVALSLTGSSDDDTKNMPPTPASSAVGSNSIVEAAAIAPFAMSIIIVFGLGLIALM
jgi:hypothetical protein